MVIVHITDCFGPFMAGSVYNQKVDNKLLVMSISSPNRHINRGIKKSVFTCPSTSFLLVHSVFASWGANRLPAGALCRAPSHITRLELGLLWRVCLLSCLVPPRLDRLPLAGTECHLNLQADFPSHPP